MRDSFGKLPRRTPPKYADLIAEELLISPEELAQGNAYWRDMLKAFDQILWILKFMLAKRGIILLLRTTPNKLLESSCRLLTIIHLVSLFEILQIPEPIRSSSAAVNQKICAADKSSATAH